LNVRRLHESIHPDTSLGPVRLTVADIDAMQSFYEQAIGLETLEHSDGTRRLGVGDRALVDLVHRPGAPLRPPGTTGLFHLAILVPSRADLADAIRRLIAARWSLSGASDHLVSEALYLDDPEGNGIEIYRDRERAEWRYTGGELKMSTLPLDLRALLDERGPGDLPAAMPPGTRIGHVHLQVGDLSAAETFYRGALGFEITVRSYPGALFVSAGGYHHHVGLNTWAGRGAPPPPRGARGLDSFEVVLPAREELQRIERNLEDAAIEAHTEPGGLRVADPSSNDLLLRSPG
jgi:catechol 2,3-dioxygenase